MKLQFKKIHNDTRFNIDFDSLSEQNGTIEFKTQKYAQGGLAVVYAPNGTGKSSFATTLKTTVSSDNNKFEALDDLGTLIVPETKAFHVIEDQISRHIILGDESQYLVGQDIKREYELKKKVSERFKKKFQEELPVKYKDSYGVSTVSSPLLNRMQGKNSLAYEFIRSIVNKNSRGKNIEYSQFVGFIRNPENREPTLDYDEEKLRFVVKDYSKVKVIELLMGVELQNIQGSANVRYVEQHDDAIYVLNKYHLLHSCIVCDNQEFDGDMLLAKKQENRQRIYSILDNNTKKLLDKVVRDASLIDNDPFEIKRIVMDFISGENVEEIHALIKILNKYVDIILNKMIHELLDCFNGTTMLQDYNELVTLQENNPELDSDDLMYIQSVISENIDRDIRVVRNEDSDRNFKLMLGDSPLLNVERDDMQLSTGEQNFISLAFELLLAKNSSYKYIVIDDPISSFDSLYKNKIAFCIVKFLENKKQIVLTHNLDLVRLLEVQLQGCFNLYLLNNVDGGKNGFIRINDKEKEILINLASLISLLQNKDGTLKSIIKNRRQFLTAMVPFMRGYAHVCLDTNGYYGKLSNIMHGYRTASVDLIPIYNSLFGEVFEGSEVVCANDILSLECSELDFLNKEQYPLFAEALRQTLIYYHLRMKVERNLVDIFHISVTENDILMLNDIIQKAFRCANSNDPEFKRKTEYRVFFTSRKTLLNEFNHFEGNINIFQPAIDISASRLQKEIDDIETKLTELSNRYSV